MEILFITSSRIGDAVLTTGVLSHLIKKNPDAKVTIACGSVAAPLFEHTPGLKKLIIMREASGLGRWFELWKELFPGKWDIVVDMRGSMTSWFLNAKRRYIWTSKRDKRHRAHHIAEILGAERATETTLWTSDAIEEKVEKLLPKGKKIISIAPAANWIGKQWDAKKFTTACNEITKSGGIMEGASVAIFAAPHEKEMIQDCIDNIDGAIDLVGKVSLLDAYAIFKRSDLFIGNDSGLMHMAAASGCPTLGLFGPTRENNYGPWGRYTGVVRTPESTDHLLTYKDENRTLMNGLEVKTVITGIKKLLGESPRLESAEPMFVIK